MTNRSFPPFAADVADRYRAAGVWTTDTFVSSLDEWAAQTPDKPVAQEPRGPSCSYGEMKSRSQRLANSFLELGLRKGDVIAIQLPSCIEFLIAYIAAARMGSVLATMHVPYRDAELEPLLRFSEAKAVICGQSVGSYEGPVMMDRLRKKIPDIAHLIVVGSKGTVQNCLQFDELIAGGANQPVSDGPLARDPVLLCFTSGTSSSPKGVMHSFETLTANARAYSKTIDLTSEDRSLITPPFTHIFGLECFHNTLVTGGTLVPVEQYLPQTFAGILETAKPTVVYVAPAHLAGTLKAGKLVARNLASIRHVILGGAICPPHVAAEFETFLPNGRVGNLFGMTETLLTTQTIMSGSARSRHSTVGRAVPGIDVRIVSDEGIPVVGDEVGELQMRGFSVMSGYMKNPDANSSAFTADGWLRTGDLSRWDEEGNITIVGRKKDLINRGGVKINPSDIENIIMEHDQVMHAALVSMDDDVLGERICAFVTVVNDGKIDLDGLCRFLLHKGVAKMRWPERLVVIDEMPMTPTKKVIKGALQLKLRDLSA